MEGRKVACMEINWREGNSGSSAEILNGRKYEVMGNYKDKIFKGVKMIVVNFAYYFLFLNLRGNLVS